MKHISLFALVVLVLSGCSSALIYETEKVALSIEARSDPSQPVSGTFGAKQRVALVLPGKNSGVGKPGEALSVVSYFNLDLDTGTSINDDGLIIDTVLLTGEAASQFKDDSSKAAPVFKTISTDPDNYKLALIKIARHQLMYTEIKTRAEAGDPAAKRYKEGLDELSSLIPDRYSFNLYDHTTPTVEYPQNYKRNSSVFVDNKIDKNNTYADVTSYLGQMREAIDNFDQMINSEKLTLNNNEIVHIRTLKNGYAYEKEILKKEFEAFQKQITGKQIVASAIDYYTRIFKE
jgi:uncharacterized protein YceK